MTVLVVYAAYRSPLRTSLADHLFSFRRHGTVRTLYVNAAAPGAGLILRAIRADLIVFHTLLVDVRFNHRAMARIERRLEPLRRASGVKVLLPQDEYFDTDYLRRFIARFGIGHVFSVAAESEWPKIYGTLDPMPKLTRVLTGYLETATVERIAEVVGRTDRSIDVGYRAWHAEAWLGRLGRLKVQVAERFAARTAAHGLSADISTQGWGANLVGDAWFAFLASTRWTIGAEGGASVIDRDGTLMERTREYVRRHPTAGFAEIEAACFPGLDGEIDFRALSPRHLEACATLTGQALVDGDYSGVLRAGEHYLAVRPDFSNLDEVLDQMGDERRRQAMVERAYADIVASGRYAYPAFVRTVVDSATAGLAVQPERAGDARLAAAFEWLSWRWVSARTLVRRLVVLPARRLRSAAMPVKVATAAGSR